MKSSLKNREWVVIASLLSLIATLSVISLSSIRAKETVLTAAIEEKRAQPFIEIEVVGAVKNPGVYRCVPGSTIEEILKLAGLEKTADRKSIDKKRVMYSSQKVVIADRK